MNDDRTMPPLPAALEGGKPPFYIEPHDAIEDDLLCQMEKLSAAAGHCFKMGMQEGMSYNGKVGYIGLAAKLTRSYAALVQALDHHRGNGVTKQEITVQYVNVAQGGQAVIGDVSPRQGGGNKKMEKQPQEKQIDYAPAFTMPSAHAQRPVPVSGDAEW